MLGRIKRTTTTLKSVLATEVTGDADIPFATKLKLWRGGFKSASHHLFDLERNDPRDYVSDLEVARAGRINGAFGRILKDKLLFASTLAPYAQVPDVLGIVERGQLYPLTDSELTGVDALASRAGSGVIFKPAQGNKGNGVFSVAQDGADGLRLNDVPTTPAEVAQKIAALDGYLVVAKVQQAAYAQEIFPGSAEYHPHRDDARPGHGRDFRSGSDSPFRYYRYRPDRQLSDGWPERRYRPGDRRARASRCSSRPLRAANCTGWAHTRTLEPRSPALVCRAGTRSKLP